jgi:dipeptidyl aminopeptidase/acylaminoacyl peptidase
LSFCREKCNPNYLLMNLLITRYCGILLSGFGFAVLVARAQNASPPQIFRDQVVVNWFPGSAGRTNQFWYCCETGRGKHEFVRVDAAAGTRRSAFDHVRLGEALAKATGKPVDSRNLAIDDLEFGLDESSVTIRGGGSIWKLDLRSYNLAPITNYSKGKELVASHIVRSSFATGARTQVEFANHLDVDVEVFWVDPDGDRVPYGSIQPGKTMHMQSFAGHVFLVTWHGEVLGVFEAVATPCVATISQDLLNEAQRAEYMSKRKENASPDGRWQLIVQGDNLFLQDLREKSQPAEQLTYDAGPSSTYAKSGERKRGVDQEYKALDPEHPTPEVYWAPDSRHFVAMRLQPGTKRNLYFVESSPSDQVQPKLKSYPYLKPGDQLPITKPHLFDVATRKEIAISEAMFANPWLISDVRWETNSSRFTFLFNQRGHQKMTVLAVDARTGEVNALIEETSKTFINYYANLYCNFLQARDEIIWMSERDGWNHLYLYDASTGSMKRQLTRGEWVVRNVDYVDEKARQVWFRAGGIVPGQDPYYVQLCRVNLDDGTLKVLTDGDGTHETQFSPDYAYFIDRWSRVDLPPIHVLRRSSDGQMICRLEEADAKELFSNNCRPPERFAAKGRDGVTDIYGVLWRPATFDEGKKYAIIESIYAGPHSFSTPKTFSGRSSEQKLADSGFVVVRMDGMGTAGRSKKFHDVCWKNLRDAGFPDRILWIRAAAASHPFMDLSRVGIVGGSAGGQNALRAMLDHGDFYRACVSDSGCHDNRMDKIDWNEQWMGWPVDESYVRSSNVVDAGKLQGKLLLMVGEEDDNVDPSSTMQVVNALIKADKDFDLVFVPGQNHWVMGTAYGWRRMEQFFEKTLGGPGR